MESLPTSTRTGTSPYTGRKKGESFHARTFRWMFAFFLGIFGILALAAHPHIGQIRNTAIKAWGDSTSDDEKVPSSFAGIAPVPVPAKERKTSATTSVAAAVAVASNEQDFREVARQTGTDKVMGYKFIGACLQENGKCLHPQAEREECRVWGHFYDTIYNRWLGKYSTPDADPIQFLEIGFYNGKGFEAYTNFMPNAELHSMEISCIEEGPRSEGKWPWGNFAVKHPWYNDLLKKKRLHCGDASDYNFLKKIWDKEMHRPGAPPLMAVIDDGAHLHDQMAESLFFWFPRIQPGGILVVEDIQPIQEANKFRTHIVPQVMKDLHWCGGEGKVSVKDDERCFPTIQPLLAGVHCEMHICVFVRNDKVVAEPDEAHSRTPGNAFTGAQECLFGKSK